MSEHAVTLVLDVGKTRTKLLAIGETGQLLESWACASRSIQTAAGYLALDTSGVQTWLCETLAGMGALRKQVRDIVPITHGAAFAGIGTGGLALSVPDYEFTGFDDRPADWAERVDPFEDTLAPLLPQGLNAATQLDWLQRHHPERVKQVARWLPYAQYWAWWLSGVATTEVSALGCHTLLWLPLEARWSALARREGWAARFAPLRNAWDIVGVIRPELAHSLGLPQGVRVFCGAHDSNACLARYLRSWPQMTLVSSGTWVVVMAPGASLEVRPTQGEFVGNVSVRGDVVPTGRFMGGRSMERLCNGAAPGMSDTEVLRQLASQGVSVDREGHHVRLPDGRTIPADRSEDTFDARERATLACLHAAQATVRCLEDLGAVGPVTVEGPLAGNDAFLDILSAVHGDVHASDDELEGTARGGFALSRWTDPRPIPPRVRKVAAPHDAGLLRQYALAAA